MCQTYVDITDGLIEAPGQDIDIGLDRLARTVAAPDRPLEQLGDAVVASPGSDRRRDDAALLLARPRALEADRVALWELPTDPALVSQARALTERQAPRREGAMRALPGACQA
ncbi:SpoIIE family protein phosphatase [Streptomyces violaceusniger]|uniref:SpoIIE family protein phosphatase n=1 Tax=Streptomyces violaceusniger TaxID=68280 RepID=UPI0001E4AD18|nr:SpoIIE family protein phosphatase [Streptomyces violaceusniger]